MIKAIDLAHQSTSFRSEQPDKDKKADDITRILPNTPKTRIKQEFQKTSSAFLDYPVKGFRGDINSDFYEFLTMGAVPYIAGSAMFMLVFNCVNKFLDESALKSAAKVGNKMALGVVFYGLMKTLSKHLVTQPVKAATGVDTEMPYENIVYPLPKEAGPQANIEVQHQQRKIFDSKEFYRKDLLHRDYYDKVAKKLGLGENLNDSVSEVSPIIQSIVSTTNTAKSLASYSWAGLGVALAVQEPWTKFFDSISKRNHYQVKTNEGFVSKMLGKVRTFWGNVGDISKTFVKTFGESCKTLWKGNPAHEGFMKHSGKAYIGFTALLTAFLTANTIIKAKTMAKNNNIETIDKTKESTVI